MVALIAGNAEDNGRRVKVTVTANVDQYVAAMQRASLATQNLADNLRQAGIREEDMSSAVRGVLKLVTVAAEIEAPRDENENQE